MICQRCGHDWNDKHGTLLRCPSCKFNHIATKVRFGRGNDGTLKLVPLDEVPSDDEDRIQSGPWDTCFGGGLVKTSVTLIGGGEGAGKSTFSLQLCDKIIRATEGNAFYIATEEGAGQIRARAERLGLFQTLNKIQITESMPEDEFEVLNLLNEVKEFPTVVILDSLPGLMGDNLKGAVELCKMLKVWANDVNCPVLIIDHLNKDEDFSGLRTLQYYVDVTLTLNVNKENPDIRVLQVYKSRFGPGYIEEYFRMHEKGLFWIEKEFHEKKGKRK